MVTIPSIGMYIVIVILPYSAKFVRDKIFADQPLTNFRGNKFRGSRIPVSHAQFSQLLNKLFTHSRITPCSAARFTLLVELRLGPYCGDNHGRQLSRQVKFEVT